MADHSNTPSESNDTGKLSTKKSWWLMLALIVAVCLIWADGFRLWQAAEYRRSQVQKPKQPHHFHKNRDGKKVYLAPRYWQWNTGSCWTVWLPDDGRSYQLCVADAGNPETMTTEPNVVVDLNSGNHIIELPEDQLGDSLAISLVVDGRESGLIHKPPAWNRNGLRTESIVEDVYAPESLPIILYQLRQAENRSTENSGLTVWIRTSER